MRKKHSILFCVLLLSGCWDERQYKDFSVVSMVGHEGQVGEITSYFSVPTIKEGATTSSIVKGMGKSTRDARMDADLKSNQTIDVSKLSVLLYSDESAKSDLYEYLDVYYRNARNQLSTYVAITEGSPEPYIEIGNELQDEAGSYYKKFIKSLSFVSIYPETDLQMVCSILFDDGIDLTLPYLFINKENNPELKGLALFNGREYTGTNLTVQQSKLLSVLKDRVGRRANFTVIYKDTPVTMVVRKIDKKWDYSEMDESGIIKLSYKLKADVQEFSKDHIEQGENKKELEQFLSQQLNEETNKLFEVLQEAKSDPLGLGRRVRAFHPEVWEKGDWNDTFSDITIKPDIKVDIKRTGILK
ncbi:Ger(x)C family spore germination protein [Paenisporosarcina quisquiliarum]|uniref:Ger(X)C family spore germination protein n=1 Tax=Paenisporosarcina quisquiliarum TaxID=365346 RepID=A0A9X3LDK9_9BACL|nr:Ger(x)C family spore germination protein [Paenisporosarcina quisquiliarum]MCZ8535872.1 Ger(x)C family spore germination protein [Paenisporosarcina quisquiliarum]